METPKKNIELIRNQLFALGLTSLSVGIVPQAIMRLFYPELGFFTSISSSATTGVKVGMVLPFALGVLALFMFTYKGYEPIDSVISGLIGVCFSVVAAQPCYSPWVKCYDKIGVFGLSPSLSNTVHSYAAVIGFILMGCWVALLFTKTDKEITQGKKVRNIIYFITGGLCIFGAGILLFDGFIGFDRLDRFDNIQKPPMLVWWAEECVLAAYGIAVLVKSKFWRETDKSAVSFEMKS